MPYQSKWKGGPKSRVTQKRTPTRRRLNFTRLLAPGGADHISRPSGGGRDTQSVRARLTAIVNWTMTGAQSFTINRNPQVATEWSYYAGIYDQFKVNGMKVTFPFPKYTAASSALGTPFTIYPEAVVMVYDNDSITAPGTFAAAYGYSTAKTASLDGNVAYELKTLPKGAVYGASALGYINSSEWQDVATPDSLAGTVSAWTNKLTTCVAASAFTITQLVEWDVTFKGKRN